MADSALLARMARIEPLLDSARSLKHEGTERGKQARTRLVSATGLSPQGVDFALKRCLESDPSVQELEALVRSTPTAEVAQVLLSANVFVAAHRAIAIGLAASNVVKVRASRREPEMAELLLAGAPDSFRLVPELRPHAGDRVWAYGSDQTLDEVATTLPPGVALHGHGSGFGVSVLDGSVSDSELEPLLCLLAEDIALFDQRGCLSPRVLLVTAGPSYARDVARALAGELERLETRLPRGRVTADEAAEITAYRSTASYLGELFPAGLGFVSAGSGQTFRLPPVGRHLHVGSSEHPTQDLAPLRPMITSCAFAGAPGLGEALRKSLPGARHCPFGQMQCPPFDGPVDRRDS